MASLEDEFAFKAQGRSRKCLAGVSIMLVDDSRAVSEAVRLMAKVSGARIRRADCIASAERHLMLFRPDVVIADLGLPDGSGADLAATVAARLDPAPGFLILSGTTEDVAAKAAEACGAGGYLLKPIETLGVFQAAVISVLPQGGIALPDWNADFDAGLAGSDFYEQDLENALDLFEEAIREENGEELSFGAQFLAGVAGTAGDAELEQCARAVLERLRGGHAGRAAGGLAVEMIKSRLVGEISQAG